MGRHRKTPVDHCMLKPHLTSRQWEQVIASLALTPRETDVVRLLIDATADKQIAKSLSISVRAVRAHFDHIFKRHCLCDRLELVLHVMAIAFPTSQGK